MANVNRHIAGDPKCIGVNVLSAVTVELGDLMFLDNTDDLRNDGSSTANNNAYPFEYFRISGASLELNKGAVKSRFLGVAMDDKDGIGGGIDRNMSIAISGQFEFDLKPAKTVNIDDYFGASGTTSASDLFNQKVMKSSDSDNALGYFQERKVHAQKAWVWIKPAFGAYEQI